MRKNDLIKQLQAIKGNPEVVLWNGFVGDYMHIDKPVQSDLVKMTKEYWIRSVLNEECITRKDWNYQLPEAEIKELERRHRTELQYEYGEYVTEEDIAKKRYKRNLLCFCKQRSVVSVRLIVLVIWSIKQVTISFTQVFLRTIL